MGRHEFTQLSAQTFGRALVQTRLTHEALLRVLSYDPLTGIFTRLICTSNAAPAGAAVGSPSGGGYLKVGTWGKQYYAHRLAWFYVTGEWPQRHIDHINGNRSDNRFANLRDVGQDTNMQNMRAATSASTTGLLGTSPSGGGFTAHIRIAGKSTNLGTFPTAQEAHEVYLAAKRVHHKGCTL